MKSRYSVPSLESFRGPIADDEFEVDIAKTKEDKDLAFNARASKIWRMLRLASKTKLKLFDKLEDGKNLQALFPPEGDESEIREEMREEIRDEMKEDPKEGMKENRKEDRQEEERDKKKDDATVEAMEGVKEAIQALDEQVNDTIPEAADTAPLADV